MKRLFFQIKEIIKDEDGKIIKENIVFILLILF